MATEPLNILARALLRKPHHALGPEEANVLQKIEARMPIAQDAADVADARATFGEHLSDRVAAVGGSWGFIIVFSLILLCWMLLNSDILSHWGMAFDPYPYIFLNLMLSTLAAIQAPVIMMSQNRQAAKDRLAASLDYEVNLRAELEILRIHGKLDLAIAERLNRILAAVEAGPSMT